MTQALRPLPAAWTPLACSQCTPLQVCILSLRSAWHQHSKSAGTDAPLLGVSMSRVSSTRQVLAWGSLTPHKACSIYIYIYGDGVCTYQMVATKCALIQPPWRLLEAESDSGDSLCLQGRRQPRCLIPARCPSWRIRTLAGPPCTRTCIRVRGNPSTSMPHSTSLLSLMSSAFSSMSTTWASGTGSSFLISLLVCASLLCGQPAEQQWKEEDRGQSKR